MKFYASVEKADRAKQVMEYPHTFGDNSVERKLLNLGNGEGLKGENLEEYIYKGLGGLVLEGAKAEKVKKAVEAKKGSQKKRVRG